jgi:4-hydroxymandelate oxidase
LPIPHRQADVFDFQPVMKNNVPPAHFGYMATGVDDEVTLRANREGFRKFELRPRLLIDVSNIDMPTSWARNTTARSLSGG